MATGRHSIYHLRLCCLYWYAISRGSLSLITKVKTNNAIKRSTLSNFVVEDINKVDVNLENFVITISHANVAVASTFM